MSEYRYPHRGVLILVLGILGFVLCPLIGIAAWVMGDGDLKRMDSGYMDPAGRDLTRAGRILGMVNTGIAALYLLILAVVVVVAMTAKHD